MAIDEITANPDENNPATIAAEIDLFVSQIKTVIPQINAATLALDLNSTSDTSSTSNSVGTGSKTFTVSSGKSWLPGMFLIIADAAAPTANYIVAQVSSYSSTTLQVNGVHSVGSGTKTSWIISFAGAAIPSDLIGDHEVIVNNTTGYASTNNKIPNFGTVVREVGSFLTLVESNATDGCSVTVNQDGIYCVTFNFSSSVAQRIGVSVNSSELTTDIGLITPSDRVAVTYQTTLVQSVSVTQRFSAGDVIRPHTNGAGSVSATLCRFSVCFIRKS